MQNMHSQSIFKTIVPGLVSIKTSKEYIPGSYLFQNFDFFEESKYKLPFHYTVMRSKIHIPKKYDFRSGYYLKKENCWYYSRKICGIRISMKYNPDEKIFHFTAAYLKLPFEIGGILPAGKHVADMITLDLTLAGYVVLRGGAYKHGNISTAILRPSFNGKTSLVKDELDQGSRYIAEDILIINPVKQRIYPTMALARNYGRNINKKMYVLAKKHSVKSSQMLNSINMFGLDSFRNSEEELLRNYCALNTLDFSENRFIKAYIFIYQLRARLENTRLFLHDSGFKISITNKSNREQINMAHWNNVGANYAQTWLYPSKELINKEELNFVTKVMKDQDFDILDIGIGTGRIIDAFLKASVKSNIYGLDISKEMILYCKSHFENSVQVKALKVSDVSKLPIPYRKKFNLITAIRVLKYSENWQEIIEKLSRQLRTGGILIFTMTNSNSINRFGHYKILHQRETIKELETIVTGLGLSVTDMRTFSRLPDKLYFISQSAMYIALINTIEKVLKIFGKTKFGREIFVCAIKK
jgi:ubiquinone/menaquinone biosynthesis C-methylase UbiE